MAEVCPTVTATSLHEYERQLALVTSFAERIHIDVMDGELAPTVSPPLSKLWLPLHKTVDLHLMYQRPMEALDDIIRLKPDMVIVHNEADVHHMHFVAELHKHDIKAGLAVLADTPIEYAYQIMHSFDHVLIFSGNLGHHGGVADLGLLEKAKKARRHHDDVEIGWDGGVSLANAVTLAQGGIDVLNAGGAVHSAENPQDAYATLETMVNI